MPEYYALLLSDHLADALHALHKARKAVADEKIIRREAVVREITQAELSVSRVIGLIAGEPQ
jgi:hypothetical protein